MSEETEVPDVYKDDWAGEDWSAVQRDFAVTVPEPHRVIVARYLYEDYSGDADVIWQNADGSFGYVSGGHCSCWGLEDQWEPEIYTPEQMAGQIERAQYGVFKQYADRIRQFLPTVSSHDPA